MKHRDQGSQRNRQLVRYARQNRRENNIEGLLWGRLRKSSPRFRRQEPIGPYIVDFACMKRKLVIEIDGASHANRLGYDLKRRQYLESLGFQVLKFDSGQVGTDLAGVLEVISNTMET